MIKRSTMAGLGIWHKVRTLGKYKHTLMKKISATDLEIICRLATNQTLPFLVYDPDYRLQNTNNLVVYHVHALAGLHETITANGMLKWCVVNLSTQALPPLPVDFIIEFHARHKYKAMDATRWCAVNNPDHSLRWLFPPKISKPWFLWLYNNNTPKGKLYKAIVQLLFAYRLNTFVRTGWVSVHARQPLYFVKLLHNRVQINYSIFTGTVGNNRKIVIADATLGSVTHFVKLPLGAQAKTGIHNECISLNVVRLKPLAARVPEGQIVDGTALRLSNVKPVVKTVAAPFGKLEADFVTSLYAGDAQLKNYTRLHFCADVKRRLTRMKNATNLDKISHARLLLQHMWQLHERLVATDAAIPVAMMHGDFTPWNCYKTNEHLYVYDWELAQPAMPLLYDVFHYVIQSQILLHRARPEAIRHQLALVLEHEDLKKLVRQHNINIAQHYQYYLLNNVSYYLELYLHQPQLHLQVQWLTTTWLALLQAEAAPTENNRQLFLQHFFKSLYPRHYAVLKTLGKEVHQLAESSDLDLLVREDELPGILQWIEYQPGILKLTITRKPFMTTVALHFNDRSFLSIDLIHRFYRKSLEYLNTGFMLSGRQTVRGITVLRREYDFLYIFMFYYLNHSTIPQSYLQAFDALSAAEKNRCRILISRHLGVPFDENTMRETSINTYRQQLLAILKQYQINSWHQRVKRYVKYLRTTTQQLRHAKGLVITFSGVDGAGKSTVLNQTKALLQEKYRRNVVVLRHRPSILPILSAWRYGRQGAETRSQSRLPRQGTNVNGFSSYLRFSYYFIDYLLGQLYIKWRYQKRGYVVLYDRYYFDFLADGRRSNLAINSNIVRRLYALIQKPMLNFFLYADASIILERKQELTEADITQLTQAYSSLFKSFNKPAQYISIQNHNLEATLQRVEESFIHLN